MGVASPWDRFWAYDRLSSFGTGVGSGNYCEPIAAGWRAFFGSLPPGSRVLDLCTGNGAIAVIAVEAGDGLQVTGADLAAVEPAAFVTEGKGALAKVRFLARTPAEQLPLANRSFDAVTSQYGIEYSDLAHSVPEAVRVLAPGGRMRFACHAAEGSVAADTRLAIADTGFVLDDLDLVGRASACVTAILAIERGRESGAPAQSAAQAEYAAFRDGLAAVAARAQSATDTEMLCCVHRSLTDVFQQRQALDEPEIAARLGNLQAELEAHRARELALLGAAQSADQMAALGERLHDLGLDDVTLGEQRDGADLIGHVIEARKA